MACSTGCDAISIFEVSSRHISCCGPQSMFDSRDLRISRRDQDHLWQTSSLDEISAEIVERPTVRTIIYVHGNWLDRCEAKVRAQLLCSRIQATCNDQPYRLILFSWPSQREPHPVQDIRQHAACTELQGTLLADFVSTLPSVDRVSFIGFSLGGRVITSALHQYACRIGVEHSSSMFNVSLIAAAIDRCWLVPGNKHGRSMEVIGHLVNLYNSRDPVLRRFRFIDTLARPVAAGLTGFPNIGDPRSSEPLAGHSRLQQYDCSAYLGLTNDEKSYFYKCPCFRHAIENLFSMH